jgi:hypothetical protein
MDSELLGKRARLSTQLTSATENTDASEVTRAEASNRLSSLRNSDGDEACAFLRTLPFDPSGTFDNAQFKLLLDLRLNLDLSYAQGISRCKCRKAFNGGHHLFSCNRSFHPIFQDTHSSLVSTLTTAISEATDAAVVRNPPITQNLVADFSIEPFGTLGCRKAYIDVASCLSGSAEDKVKEKHRKYDEAAKNARTSFYAFVVELTGKWAPENERVLKCIAEMAQFKLGLSRTEFYFRSLRRQISLGHAQRFSKAVLRIIDQRYKPQLPRPPLLLFDFLDFIGGKAR